MTVKGEGGNVTLMCEAMSEPPPTIEWLKDGVTVHRSLRISTGLKYSVSLIGKVNSLRSILVVFSIETSDTGGYTCQVSNIHGSQSATAHLEVQG